MKYNTILILKSCLDSRDKLEKQEYMIHPIDKKISTIGGLRMLTTGINSLDYRWNLENLFRVNY